MPGASHAVFAPFGQQWARKSGRKAHSILHRKPERDREQQAHDCTLGLHARQRDRVGPRQGRREDDAHGDDHAKKRELPGG